MSKGSLSSKNDKTAIRQKHIPFEGSSFKLPDFDSTETLTSRGNGEHCPRNSDIVSATDFRSALSYVWNRATLPISILLKTELTCKPEVHENCDIRLYSDVDQTVHASTSGYDQTCSSCLNSKINSVNAARGSPEFSIMNQKMLHGCGSYYFRREQHTRSTVTHSSYTNNRVCSALITPDLGGIYGWMTKINLSEPKNRVKSVGINGNMKYNHYLIDHSNLVGSCVLSDTCSPDSLKISSSEAEVVEHKLVFSGEDANYDSIESSMTSENNFVHAQAKDTIDLKKISSDSKTDNQEPDLAPSNLVINLKKSVDDFHEHAIDRRITDIKSGFSEIETNFSVKEKQHHSLARQEHAFAGAMAGIFVSLCLHPMDTLKTVIQSCHANKKSLHYIGSSIISERGIAGLYRGISSNIICSAPISAVYMSTYESAKKTMLPYFPQEYHSLAHCVAGGCASISTSFIFTPSERIKQQMQIGSHYRNCWNALIEVVRKGGLISLYAGWGAVICRNVPHSVIKFYTYESLRSNLLPSVQSCAQANTITTLVCGGLAGSIASLFSTPFDVVKTRLQTQIPGSVSGYNGVLNTLVYIGNHEGLKGLYRGLTPRLTMYMVQGALFFASYESFKRLLSLKAPELSAERR